MEFSEKIFFMTLLALALIESVFPQDPFGSGSTEVVDRIKLRGRPKDKCRFLKSDKEKFQRCQNISGSENVTDGKRVENGTNLEPLNGITSAKEESITVNGTVQRTTSITTREMSSTIKIESPLDFPIGSTENGSGVTSSEEPGRNSAAASTSTDASASASTITSSNISSTDTEVTITNTNANEATTATTSTSASTTTSESTSSSVLPPSSTKSNPTSRTKSTKSSASKKSAKTTLESSSSPSAKKKTSSTKSQKTDVTKSPKKITTSGKIIRNPLVGESAKFLNTTDPNKSNSNFTNDNESLAELPEELKQIEDEINEASKNEIAYLNMQISNHGFRPR